MLFNNGWEHNPEKEHSALPALKTDTIIPLLERGMTPK